MDVISVHVPKTAGSTFGSLLATIYGVERIYNDYGDVPMNPRSRYHVDREGWRESASTQLESIGPEFRAVHGHFAAEKYAEAFPEARRVAWVRHPASWVISLYFFWKHVATTSHPLVQRLHADKISLEEFAQDPWARDQVSGVFLKGVSLESFDFVGVQEHFEADVHELAHLMGWPAISIPTENPSPEPGYADLARELHQDERLIDRLVSLNEGDMALYEDALRHRARRAEIRKARTERYLTKSALLHKFHADRRARATEVA